jgi:hypothetical protein
MRQVRRMLQWVEHYIFEADMGYYERISNAVFWLLAENSNNREQFSVDESFYNWTGLVADTDEAVKNYALQLQEYILQATVIHIVLLIYEQSCLQQNFLIFLFMLRFYTIYCQYMERFS